MSDNTVADAQHALTIHMEQVQGKLPDDCDVWGQTFVKLWVSSPSHSNTCKDWKLTILQEWTGANDDKYNPSIIHLLQARWIFQNEQSPSIYAWAGPMLMPKYLPPLHSKCLLIFFGNFLTIFATAKAPPIPVKSTTPTAPCSMSKPLVSHLSSSKSMPLIDCISQDCPPSPIAPVIDTPPKDNSESPLVSLGTATSPKVAISPSLGKWKAAEREMY